MEQNKEKSECGVKFALVLVVVFLCIIGYMDTVRFSRPGAITNYEFVEYNGMSFKCPKGYLIDRKVLIENTRFKVGCESPKKLEQFLEKNFSITWDTKAGSVQQVFNNYLEFNGFDGMKYIRDYDSKIGTEPCKVIDYTVYGMAYGRFRFFKSGNAIVVYQTESDHPRKLDEFVFSEVGGSIKVK